MRRKSSSMFANKQLFSIRKVHFGAASVIIGALIALGSGNVVNANTLDGAVVDNSSNSAQASEVLVENNATEDTGLIADTNSAENATSLVSAESTDSPKTTNYVVDAEIKLFDEYIDALEDRNSIMNELKGQKEVDGVLVFNQPKKAPGYKEDAENLQLLENLGKEHLVSNTYSASEADKGRFVDPLNLSESEFEELNVFSTDIANQIRHQIIDRQTRKNQTVTVEKAYVPVGMQNLAFEVTNKAHAIDKERGLSVIVAGDTGGYHGYEYFPWGDKSSGTPERTGIIREAIENNKLDSSQLDLHPEWGQRPASTFTITTINSTSSSHYDNRISLVGMTMGRLKELIYEGYRTGLFTLASETRPERKWEHALNLTSLETRRLPQYQPNTMISSGLYFIQNRDTWAYNPATGKKEDTKKPVSLTGQYFVNFNFYQDSYSPVVENRINHGESAPGYIDGFNTTLINNVIPQVETFWRLTKNDNGDETGAEKVEVTTIGTKTTVKVLETKINSKTVTELPFNTVEENDATLALGERVTKQEGVKGSHTVGTTYSVQNGQLVETPINIRIEPRNELVLVGTKVTEAEGTPKVEVVWRQTETGAEKVEVTTIGTKTTEKVLDTKTNSETVTELPYEIEEEKDSTLALGERVTKQEGVKGSHTIGTTYSVQDGQLVETPINIRIEPQNELVLVGTRVTEAEGTPKVEVVWRQTETGVEKVEVTTIGTKTTEKVLETKVNSKTVTELSFNTVEENDATLALGKRVIKQEGVKGSLTTGTNYSVKDGQIEETSINNRIEPTNEIILVGTKVEEALITSKGDQVPPSHYLPEAKLELKEVTFDTVYENDSTLELGKELVVREGQNGSVQVITIGDQVTEIVVTEKVDKIVKRGTLVKEEVKPEVTSNAKPVVKTVVNTIGNIPSGSSVSNSSAKTLPQTGEDTSFASVLGVSLLSSALFIAKRRRDV